MRLLALVAVLVLAAGCPGSDWKECTVLRILDDSGGDETVLVAAWRARYRVVQANPLTVEYEGHLGGESISGVVVATEVQCGD
jgi:hypothetical protein